MQKLKEQAVFVQEHEKKKVIKRQNLKKRSEKTKEERNLKKRVRKTKSTTEIEK